MINGYTQTKMSIANEAKRTIVNGLRTATKTQLDGAPNRGEGGAKEVLAAGARLRSSTVANPFGIWNRLGLGSEGSRMVAVKVCVPKRGSFTLETRLIPSRGEYQYSCSTVNRLSFPITPGL